MWMFAILAWLVGPVAHAEDPFPEVVRAYFRTASICFGIKKTGLPSRKTVEKEVAAIEEAAKRFFPESEAKARKYLFVLMISESEGNLGIAKPDPKTESLGLMCVKLLEARVAGRVYALPYRKRGDVWFRSTLMWNPRASILYGTACLRMDYAKTKDWPRAILTYKYGEAGFRDAIAGLKEGKTIDDLRVWRTFVRRLKLIDCIEARMVKKGDDCQRCSKRYAENGKKRSG